MELFLLIPLTIMSVFALILVGMIKADERWQRETIKRGLAVHDPITGKWRWKEPTDKEPTP